MKQKTLQPKKTSHHFFAFTFGLAVCLAIVFAQHKTQTLQAEKPVKPKSLTEELPRIKPVEATDVQKTFKVQKGFQLELVAAEPNVADPVDACFDADGRMYVAEMHGYPFSQEPTRLNPKGGGKKNAGVIRLLTDTNGDGKFDHSTKFADNMTWPTSVCCYRGGVFVLAPPHLHYFKDTDGDGVADVRRIVFTGFNRNNVQSLANNMKWGLDQRIYTAGGRNPSVIQKDGKTLLKLGNRDFSFDPITETVESATGGVQFGHSMDNWGNRFVCSNSNHIQHVVFPYRYIERNPYFAVSGPIRSIAQGGAAAPVFRTSSAEPWRIVRTRRRVSDPNFVRRSSRTEQFAIGFFTSATGVTIYRGDAYPPEFRGNAFIGDVGGNLIHRKIVEPNNASFIATRADENVEFITSTDNWFRPVNFVNAPDGSLFILDMYRETIEHPYSIPEDIKTHLDLEGGDDRGRIYRLVSPNMKRVNPPKLSKATISELVAQLESKNAWNRETAQRLLWEQQDKSAVKPLVSLLNSSQSPLAKLHCLYTLKGLNAITPSILLQSLDDSHAGVREHAVLLSERFVNSSPKLAGAVIQLTTDPSDRVRFQVAFTLGEVQGDQASEALSRLARNPKNNNDIRTAVMTSVKGKADRIAIELMNDESFVKQSAATSWLAELSKIIGSDKNVKPAFNLLEAATAEDRRLSIQQVIVTSLGEGLSRRGSSITALLADKSADSNLQSRVQNLFENAAQVTINEKRSLSDRTIAVQLLAHADFKLAAKTLPDLLSPQIPQSLQVSAVQALSNQSDPLVASLLVAEWRSYSPRVRSEVIDSLLRSTNRLNVLFIAIKEKRIQAAEVGRDKKQLLINHPNTKIRDRAKALFGGEVSPDRAKVVAAYQSVLEFNGDAIRGKQIFEKRCSICHRVGKIGHQVAPDLASVQNKSEADLIISILDPNREAQPNFTTYTVVTDQGKILTGIIATETANSLTLRRAEAKEDVVLRSNIDTLSSNGKSLMPEGLEKDVKPQQLADVIAFIKTIKPAKKK